MTKLQKAFTIGFVAVLMGLGIYKAHQVSQLTDRIRTLQQQQESDAGQMRKLQEQRDKAVRRLTELRAENTRLKTHLEQLALMQTRREASLQAGKLATTEAVAPAQVVATSETPVKAPSSETIGRALGTAVVRGDSGAFDQLLVESRTAHQNFNAHESESNDQQRGELARKIFQPMHVAFKVIEEAAALGNQSALDALARALQFPELKGLAVSSLGPLAGKGDEGALEVLIHPEKYGALLSSTISALRPAADNGNQRAIDALAAVAGDASKRPLWYMTAGSLKAAATAGNSVAIDALISMSASTNRSIRKAVAEGLSGAAANQNAKAGEALRAMGIQ